MKQLSIEEKAKAYDEAYKKAAVRFGSNVADEIFLKESEDEKIRKQIKAFIKSRGSQITQSKTDAWIAWLEKQGEKGINGNNREIPNSEQKPADEVEPKFKVGDWVVLSTSDGEKVVQIDSIEYFKSGEPRYITSEGRWFGNGTKARLLTDKDVEITTIPESKAIVNKIKFWSEEDENMITDLSVIVHTYFSEISGIPFKYDLSEDKIRTWLEYLKDRIQPQPKQEWSEEDEKCIRLSTDIIDSSLRAGFCVQLDRDRCVDWLKSLKDRYTWKPSDEQMVTLEYYMHTLACNSYKETLFSLYQDLKKLREELVMKYCVENEIFGHLESIINGADRMTSGNFMHNKNAIKLSAKIIIDRLHSLGIHEKE